MVRIVDKDMQCAKLKRCEKLREFVDVQVDVIQRHLDRHKWYRGISDSNAGLSDFVQEYGWLMRDLYCHHICEFSDSCVLGDQVNEACNRPAPSPSAAE
jgi:hypothetical protein